MSYVEKEMNLKRSFVEYKVTQPTTNFALPFEFVEAEQNLRVRLNGIDIEDLGYSFLVTNNITVQVTPAIPHGTLSISRETDIDENLYKFTAGALFEARTMDENFEQIRHAQQEVRDGFEKLSDATYAIIDTLQDVGQSAQDAADAAEQAAKVANDAAAQVNDKVSQVEIDYIHEKGAALPHKDGIAYAENAVVVKDGVLQQWKGGEWVILKPEHNDLDGRTMSGAHPVSAISYGSINQEDYNDGLESIAEMLAIQNPPNGMRVYVKSYHAGLNKGGGWYIFDESQSSNTDDILNINGWLLQHNNPINLHSCGLKGDGVSDDRPALQKAIRVASRAKLNLIGNPSDTYLLNSLSSESGSVCLVWCNTSYVNLALNGATIKVANNLGDYQAVFAAGWAHTHFKITNGTIDQNTTNNPPQSPVLWSNTNGQRSIVSAYSVPHKYFEVTSIKILDALGVWEINTTQAEVVNICDNEIYYSALNTTHTDRTSIYVLPRRWGKVNSNKFYGDTFGNATTAVELHGSNCEFIGNTVIGFRSPVFIVPDAQEDNSAIYQNIFVRDNNFVSCQQGVLIWVESSASLNRPMQNIHITGNKILIDSRLITNKDMGLLNGTGVGFLGSDEDCVIDGLYIQNNKINYLYNAENIGKDSPAGIDLTSFMPSAYFKWGNIYIQNNIVEGAPCNGISIGNKAVGTHTSSISNVLVSGNNVLNCGVGRFDENSFAVKIHNPSRLSKIRIADNTFTESEDAGVTWMKFVNVGAGDGSAITGVRFYDNETSFHRSTSINDMYVAGGVMINDIRKNHLNNNDTNTKAKYGSTFTDLNTGNTIVQSSLNANTPVWKTITH